MFKELCFETILISFILPAIYFAFEQGSYDFNNPSYAMNMKKLQTF